MSFEIEGGGLADICNTLLEEMRSTVELFNDLPLETEANSGLALYFLTEYARLGSNVLMTLHNMLNDETPDCHYYVTGTWFGAPKRVELTGYNVVAWESRFHESLRRLKERLAPKPQKRPLSLKKLLAEAEAHPPGAVGSWNKAVALYKHTRSVLGSSVSSRQIFTPLAIPIVKGFESLGKDMNTHLWAFMDEHVPRIDSIGISEVIYLDSAKQNSRGKFVRGQYSETRAQIMLYRPSSHPPSEEELKSALLHEMGHHVYATQMDDGKKAHWHAICADNADPVSRTQDHYDKDDRGEEEFCEAYRLYRSIEERPNLALAHGAKYDSLVESLLEP